MICGSFFIISGTFGLISSVGLFQSFWQENQLKDYTGRDVGWVAAVNSMFFFFGPAVSRGG